ncbi:MAG: hypothetical protein R2820_05285 [Cyclobacteriaceae bacterium]|nr:hypothetical protein [Cyclobacteriaceae bacterium]
MRKLPFILFFSMLWCESWSQQEIGEITNQYNEYNERYQQVRVHLELNQPKYAPGDTAFFKAYFLTYQFQPIKGSHFITIDLLNSLGQKVHTQNVKVNDGKVHNQIVFPGQLPPGNYRLEAYNDWMKNFDHQFFFHKELEITGRRRVADAHAATHTVGFYPEGGRLVSDVENTVSIVSSRKAYGSLRDDDGNEITSFDASLDGFASVRFKPENGKRYFIKMAGEDSLYSTPASSESGLALQVVSLGECSPLQLQISAPEASPFRKRELYLVATAYGKVTYSKVFTLADTETTPVLVPYRSLHDGLNQLYVMSGRGEVITERLWFMSPMYSQVEIKTKETELLHPRDSVEIEVSLSDFFGNPIKGEFSVSITNQKLFDADEKSEASLRNSLYLFNDLPDLQLQYESSGLSEEVWMKDVNKRLVSQVWKRCSWDEVLSAELKNNKMIPFKQSLSFKGQIFLTETGQPLQDSSLVSFYQDKRKIVYSTYCNSRGEFELPLINDYSNNDRFYYKVEPVNPRARIGDYYLQSDMAVPQVEALDVALSESVDAYGEYIHNKRIIDHSYRVYLNRSVSGQQATEDSNTPYLAALSREDVNITVGDFVVFETMEDLIHEVVSGVQVRKSAGNTSIRVPVFSQGYTKIPTGDPLYIVNGVFTLSTQEFLNLVPENMVYLKIINDQSKLSRFGAFGSNGVIVALTQQRQVNEESLKSKFVELPGVNQALNFSSGQLARAGLRIPNLRAALHWDPSVSNSYKGLATLKVKLTDDLGPMQVSVSGVTFDGNPFSGSIRFIVNRPGYVVIN